ncbi:ABC transporter ATP-binding protein [Pseudobacteriovorax antillogorgiicola]|uniref:Putative ABC transport system ATP-binding protein n=1 Tax=Pseudobacteriovorax antillogorgiicola TaxID=1513793 RepID=A0A1Y6C702_9BACT|nr:ABC transporter ATP-binding protein [Pseudobacteriovorax antillogorgiicola]TCS51187.1 putative ABC transport system ATP-binding protein [Pseudobacteriovorax antillogorgiicola]SMF37631.1 putative ABC transport system ATP-binding protein [Pseudobacteriovorax antillogorgiicola]
MELVVEGINKYYSLGEQSYQALRGVSARFQDDGLVALVGPSGSGKSTLLHCLGLIDPVESGQIYFEGQRIDSLGDDKKSSFRLSRFGFIFQSYHLIPTLSVVENVALPAIYLSRDVRRSQSYAKHLLERVGLGEFNKRRVSQLSGGQRQRVAIARSLVNRPRIIFADEPTANLDSSTSGDVLDLFQEIVAEEQIMAIVSTHDPEVAQRANRIIKMKDGQLEVTQ